MGCTSRMPRRWTRATPRGDSTVKSFVVALAVVVIAVAIGPDHAAGQTTARRTRIGTSVEGRPIHVEVIGNGPVDLIIVGGIHGGYEANSTRLARRVAAHFRADAASLPDHITLHVIDLMNPDGMYQVTEGAPVETFDFRGADTPPGRFNANGVDLNRNWDGNWRPTSTWRNVVVDAGDAPFSEPETRAVRDYFRRVRPAASVFYQSAGGFIWHSGAEYGWEPARELALVYGEVAGYRVIRPEPRRMPAADATADHDADRGAEAGPNDTDDDITGSADDFFFSVRHRNITVELTTHYVIEWERNLAGLTALFDAVQDPETHAGEW